MEVSIQYPKCAWKPLKTSRWRCICAHSWNTFDTGGTCPNCEKHWKETQCLECKQWSLHIDWYKNLDNWLKIELERIKVLIEAEQSL